MLLVLHYALVGCSAVGLFVLWCWLTWLTFSAIRTKGLKALLPSFRTEQNDSGSIDQVLMKKLLKDRAIQRFRKVCFTALPCSVILLLFLMFFSISRFSSLDAVGELERAGMENELLQLQLEFFASFSLFAVCLLGTMMPSMVTLGYANFAHLLGTLHVLSLLKNTYEPFWFMFQTAGIIIIRAAMSIIHGNLAYICASNLLYTGLALWSWFRNCQDERCRTTRFMHTVTLHVVVLGFICGTAYVVEWSRHEEVKAVIEARQSRELKIAVDRLLSSMCDAVLRTDSTFHLAESCPKLSAMLLRSDRHDFQKLHFSDLLWDQLDRDNFLLFTSRQHHFAQSLHVRLRDANTCAVKVQLFHVAYLEPNNSESHILGVQEIGEEGLYPHRTGAPEVVELRSPSSWVVPGETWVIGHGSPSHRSSSRSSLDDLGPLPLVETIENEMAIWVDVFTADLTILSLSHGIATLMGPSGLSGGLITWMSTKDSVEFLSWLQSVVNTRQQGGKVAEVEFNVTLKPAAAPGKLNSTVKVDSIQDIGDPNCLIVKLTVEMIDPADVNMSSPQPLCL